MKQNWEKEFETFCDLLDCMTFGEKAKMKNLIFGFIKKAKQEERERILKALPKERTDERIKKLFKECGIKSVKDQNNIWNRAEGFNDYNKQIKDIINKL